MRILSTVILLLAMTVSARAQEPTSHPIIGAMDARVLLNSDLLALPDQQRQAWVNGAVNMASQILVIDRPETAGCVANWYIRGGDGQKRLEEVMIEFPEKLATSTVYAVARLACDDL